MPRIIQSDTDKKGVLRKKAAEVPVDQIASPKIKKVITDMRAAMHTQDDAVAIAAPQIGVLLRIFVVAQRAFEATGKEDPKDRVFINPRITKLSRKKIKADEGCLSIRPLYGFVERSEKATVEAYDERGKKFTYGASGLLAQIFQHEADHLEGILFTDKATETWEFVPEEQQEHEEK